MIVSRKLIFAVSLYTAAANANTELLLQDVAATCLSTKRACESVFCDVGNLPKAAYIIENLPGLRNHFAELERKLAEQVGKIGADNKDLRSKLAEVVRDIEDLKREIDAIPRPPEDEDLSIMFFGTEGKTLITQKTKKLQDELTELGRQLSDLEKQLEKPKKDEAALNAARVEISKTERHVEGLIPEFEAVDRIFKRQMPSFTSDIEPSKNEVSAYGRALDKLIKFDLIESVKVGNDLPEFYVLFKFAPSGKNVTFDKSHDDGTVTWILENAASYGLPSITGDSFTSPSQFSMGTLLIILSEKQALNVFVNLR